MHSIVVHCNNDKIWNLTELIGFLNQNQHGDISITVNPEAPDLSAVGFYNIIDQFQFKHVEIKTSNPFEQHDIYNVDCTHKNIFLKHIPTIDDSVHQWNQKKVFLTLFGRPTAARLAISAHLLQSHSQHSHIHFNSCPTDDNITLFEFDKLATYDKCFLEPVAKLVQQLPLTIVPTAYTDFIQENKLLFDDYTAWLEKIISDPLTEYYKDILVDCVSETHVLGRTFFSTEKTTRPMWCKKSFITFGSRNHLLYLRQMGFQTFQEFWDEDYDGYEGRDRLSRIIKLIDWIGSQSTGTLETMYADMQPILNHNHNLLSTQTYSNLIKEVL